MSYLGVMRRTHLAAALAVALLLTACGSTRSSDATPGATSTVTIVRTRTTATAPPLSTTATPPPTTATASTPATVSTATITTPDSGGAGLTTDTGVTTAAAAECVAGDLTPAAVPPNGATGTVVLGFTLTNRSARACVTYGWPGIAFVNSAGSAVATQTTRTSSDILGATPPTRFTIAPGEQASFRITVHDSNDQGGEGGCGSYGTVQIIAPNDTATMQVKLPDGPAEVCGAAAISPLEPGASATGQ